jgi:hypothetical protein
MKILVHDTVIFKNTGMWQHCRDRMMKLQEMNETELKRNMNKLKLNIIHMTLKVLHQKVHY